MKPFMFPEAPAELTVVTHAALAFVLAWTIGYERFYNGRAAGTQAYCLVSTASCALTFDGERFGLELIVSGRALRGRTLNWVVEVLPDIQSIESFAVTRTSRT
jgi:hypothetical protein